MNLLHYPSVIAACVFLAASVFLFSLNGFKFKALGPTVWVAIGLVWAIWISVSPPQNGPTNLFALLFSGDTWRAVFAGNLELLAQRDRALTGRAVLLGATFIWIVYVGLNIAWDQPYMGTIQVARSTFTGSERIYPLATLTFGFWRHYIDLAAGLCGLMALALAPS